jgi:DNA-binding beta-propeller fold protein YncE
MNGMIRMEKRDTRLGTRVMISCIFVLIGISLIIFSVSGADAPITIALPQEPPISIGSMAVNPDSDLVYLASGHAYDKPGNVYVIDVFNYTLKMTIPAAQTGGDLDINSVTNTLYFANQGSQSCTIINGITNTVSGVIPVPGCPTGVGVNKNTNKIYVSSQCCPNNQCDEVLIIDGNSNTLLANAIPITGVAGTILVNSEDNVVYARSNSDTRVIDGASHTVTSTIPSFFSYAVNPKTHQLYGTCADGNFCIVNTSTYTNEYTLPIQTGHVAVNMITNHVYLTIPAMNILMILDGTTHQELSRVSVGNNPFWVATNARKNLIFVVNRDDRTISVIPDISPAISPTATTISTTVPTINITTQPPTVNTTVPTPTPTTVPTTLPTTVLTTETTTEPTTIITTRLITVPPTVPTTIPTTIRTPTPTRQSPGGFEVGILAMIGAALLIVMKRK